MTLVLWCVCVGLLLCGVPRYPRFPRFTEFGIPYRCIDFGPFPIETNPEWPEYRSLLSQFWERGWLGPNGAYDGRGRFWFMVVDGYPFLVSVYAPFINVGVTSAVVLGARRVSSRIRRRFDKRCFAGHCANCGYDLTGNISGVCPECGRPTEVGRSRALSSEDGEG